MLAHVMLFLPFRDVLSAAQVSKNWKDVADSDQIW